MKKFLLKIFLVLLFLGFSISQVFAATLYLKTAGGNWSAAATWSNVNASGIDSSGPPTAADDVVFELLSGNVTINGTSGSPSLCRSMDWTSGTGNYAGVVTAGSTAYLKIGDGTAGAGSVAMKLVTGATFNPNASSTIEFVTTSSTQQTVTSGGYTFGNIIFNASSNGNWALADNLTIISTRTLTLTKGTLHTDGTSDTAGLSHSWGIFDSNNSNTRALNLGNSTIEISRNNQGQTIWDITSGSGLTLTKGNSVLNFTGAGNFGSAKTYHNVNFNQIGTTVTINGINTFDTLTRTGQGSTGDALVLGNSQTVITQLTLNGFSAANRLLVRTSTLGTARTFTITSTTVTASNVDFRDITFSVSKDLSAITGQSGDCGGNTNITFTTAAAQYWYSNTGSWSDATKWFLASGGTGGAGRIPLPQDNVFFDSNSFSSASQTITSDIARPGKSINWTGATNSPTSSISVARTIYGSSTLISGMTLSDTAGTTFEGRGSFTVTSAGQQFTSPTISMFGGTLTMQDAFSSTGTLTLNNGTFDLNGYNITIGILSSSNSNTRAIQSTGTAGTLSLSSTGNVVNFTTATNLTISNAPNISITDTSSSSKTLILAGKTYGNLTITGSGSGAIIPQGANTFATVTIGAPKTITWPASTTTTLTQLIANGTSGNVITMNSSTPGTASTFSDSSGFNICNFCSIQDSTASGGAIFRAYNSTNVSGNTGWIFKKRILVAN